MRDRSLFTIGVKHAYLGADGMSIDPIAFPGRRSGPLVILNLPDQVGRAQAFQTRADRHAPAVRLDGLTTNDGLRSVIAPLDDHVGTDGFDQIEGGVLVEQNDHVNKRIKREHVRALVFRNVRPRIALEPANGRIGVEA